MKPRLLILIVLVCAFHVSAQTFPIQYNLPNEETTNWMRVSPYAGTVDFFFNHYGATNSDSSINQVFHMGLNVAPGGGSFNTDYPANYLQFEGGYVNGIGQRLSEVHFNLRTASGIAVRPFYSIQEQTTGFVTTILQADNLDFTNGSNQVMAQFYNGAWIFDHGTIIRSVSNNANFLQQYTTTGGVLTIAKVDSANAVQLGGGTAPVKLNSLILNGATVSMGDANSGGSGYRCLRVVN